LGGLLGLKTKNIMNKGEARFDDAKKDVKNAAADFKHATL
jgi:hypothetical protein